MMINEIIDDLAFVLSENAILGRHLLASRNLSQGEIIFQDQPLGEECEHWVYKCVGILTLSLCVL